MSSRGLQQSGRAVVAVSLAFADRTEHFGGLEASYSGEMFEFASLFLLRPGERINFTDHTAKYTFQKIPPSLAEGLHRNFLQNLSRLERHLGKAMSSVFPIEFQTVAALRKGGTPIKGVLQRPEFKLPVEVAREV